jgi:integrase/recombinase XerD
VAEHTGDKPVLEISSLEITAYLAWLRTDYQPRRFNGQINPISPKTIRNKWITLMAFFCWLTLPTQDIIQNLSAVL